MFFNVRIIRIENLYRTLFVMIDSLTEQKIHAAIDIVDVIGVFVELKRRGQNYVGLCPFHDDSSPSMYVSPARGTYKCFSCGAGGDTIDFLCHHKGMKYYEALHWLADRYGIVIPEKHRSKEQFVIDRDKESMYLINEIASNYYESCLSSADSGVGIEYFQKRGINEDTIRSFHLGYCPINSEVINAVKEQKADIKYLFRDNTDVTFKSGKTLHVDNGVGIIFKNEESGRFYDSYQGRVIFPWLDRNGSVIAFGGRCLDAATKGVNRKYVNSPESIVFRKSDALYGICQAAKYILQQDCVYVVEGYLDVLSLHQSGIRNVVSNSGVVLSSEQVKLLLHYTKNIVLVYDSDKAGVEATFRSIDILLQEGANVRCLLLPDGEDPDSYAQNYPVEEVNDCFKMKSEDFIDFQCRLLLRLDDEPTNANSAIRKILHSISLIPDAILRELYFKKLIKVSGISEGALREALE